jgi:hypothetical protein
LRAKGWVTDLRARRRIVRRSPPGWGWMIMSLAVYAHKFHFASVRAAQRPRCRARAASQPQGSVVRDFKERAFPMAEERWSVALAAISSSLLGASCKRKNQIIVTRERTS